MPLNVIVVGFKGAGKSTLGPLLAEGLGFAFDDLDRRLAEAASGELGEKVDVREAFRRLGAERFRGLERRLLAEALAGDRLLVLSLGGGAALGEPEAPEALRGQCVVYLRVPEDHLIRRVREGGWPAYLDDSGDPEAALRELLAERLPRYEAMADVIVDNPDGAAPGEGAAGAAGKVAEWMKARG
jgi:shikimate kinase